MKASQTCECLPAIVRAAVFAECLLTGVRGDGADSEEQIDVKYVLIGVGVGLFFSALFVIVKVCIIMKHVEDNNTEASMKRPSEPHLFALSQLSQSTNPEAAPVSSDMRC